MRAQTLLELPEENPFLERFYRDAARYALSTQMFFLFQRMNQLRDLAQTDLSMRASSPTSCSTRTRCSRD